MLGGENERGDEGRVIGGDGMGLDGMGLDGMDGLRRVEVGHGNGNRK